MPCPVIPRDSNSLVWDSGDLPNGWRRPLRAGDSPNVSTRPSGPGTGLVASGAITVSEPTTPVEGFGSSCLQQPPASPPSQSRPPPPASPPPQPPPRVPQQPPAVACSCTASRFSLSSFPLPVKMAEGSGAGSSPLQIPCLVCRSQLPCHVRCESYNSHCAGLSVLLTVQVISGSFFGRRAERK